MKEHRKTNPTSGRGQGRGGRKTFIDEIISKAETSQKISSLRPQTWHPLQTDYEMEGVLGPERAEETVEQMKESVEDIEEPIEDIEVEEPIEDIEVEEPVQDIESPTESVEDRASETGE